VSAQTATRRPRGRPTPAQRRADAARARARRRLSLLLLVVLGFVALGMLAHGQRVGDAVTEIGLPLRHEDVIRQQARDKDLDPALIAAVIYAESRFREGARSHAGAIGLMQLTPATAKMIARKSGGTQFTLADLDTAQVNIAYGAWYLRYLLDRYGGNTRLAVAAYNGGEGNVDRWVHEARSREQALRVRDIPFPETRAYTQKVLDARREYRRVHADALGL
jgi:soluble lytic murein transglycosylase